MDLGQVIQAIVIGVVSTVISAFITPRLPLPRSGKRAESARAVERESVLAAVTGGEASQTYTLGGTDDPVAASPEETRSRLRSWISDPVLWMVATINALAIFFGLVLFDSMVEGAKSDRFVDHVRVAALDRQMPQDYLVQMGWEACEDRSAGRSKAEWEARDDLEYVEDDTRDAVWRFAQQDLCPTS